MTMLPSPPGPAIDKGQPLKLSTSDIPPRERAAWLRDVICREYANVEVTSPVRQTLSQDLTIYPFDNLRLSVIRSSGIGLKRRPFEPHLSSHDAYLAIVLLSGDYVLEQDGNEAVLQPGDMAIFDATRPHRIHCPGDWRNPTPATPAGSAISQPVSPSLPSPIENPATTPRRSTRSGKASRLSRVLRSCRQTTPFGRRI
jgi:AraC family transcriptional activator of tynA and feaB